MAENSGAPASQRLRLYLGTLALALLCHLPSLRIPFQFDDFHHLAENPALQSLSNLPRYFMNPNLFSGRAGEGMYRPLLMVTHTLNYAIFGSAAWSFHLVSLALHLLNTALVLALLRRWTRRDGLAFIGAAFWAVAAIQHETVGYLSARSSLLAAAFMLGAILVTDQPTRSAWKSGALAALFFALGLLSKEIAFVLPLLILLRDLTLGREGGMKLCQRWPIYALTFAVMPLYLLLRSALYTAPLGESFFPRWFYTLTQTRILFYYLMKIVYPINLTIFPEQKLVTKPLALAPLLPVFGVVLLVALAAALFKNAPKVCFGIFWFGICLLPTSSVVPLFLVASIERVYLPLLGFTLIALDLGSRLFRDQPGRARLAGITAAAIIALNALTTVHQHLVWSSSLGLMRDMTRKAPNLSTGWVWLGIMEMQEQKFESARKHILKAIRLNPNDIVAQENLGKLHTLAGEEQDARALLEQFLQNPNAPVEQKVSALIKLASLDLKAGQFEPATARVQAALKLQPENSEAYLLLGQIAEARNNLPAARAAYLRALGLYPDFPEVELQLGILGYKMNDPVTARKYLEMVADRKKPWPEVYFYLGLISFIEGRTLEDQKRLEDAAVKFAEAKKWYDRGLELDPKDALVNYGLGVYFASRGELGPAQDCFEKAVAANADFPEARDNLAKVYLDRIRLNDLAGQNRESYLERAAVQIRWLLEHQAGAERVKEWEELAGRKFQ